MQIRMLGPLEVRTDDGGLVDVSGARLRGLLVALALRAGQGVPKGVLVDWIWGDAPPADATNALQRLVSRLRKVLPDCAVEGQAGGYRLVVAADAVDALRFERLVAAGCVRTGDLSGRVRVLREGLELWRGAVMEDVGVRGSAPFDAAVARLDALWLTATEERVEGEVALGRGSEVVTELAGLVAAHPVRERLVASLMRALVAAGRTGEAVAAYEHVRDALADALGADPSPELAALHGALVRGELGEAAPTGGSGGAGPTNLRAELTSFVGKSADIAAVRERLRAHRLTTLIGPGGSGKTRLASETARTLLGELPDGAWLVELAAIGPDGDVARAALAGLDLRDALFGGAPNADLTDRLVAACRDRDALLVLDNCEHVIESAAVFAHRLLGECGRLRILATSREPLGITGEALWQVEPLALPDGGAGPDAIASSPAVQLLRDRAGAVRRGLAADPRTLATMARVCRALDGMPLAIELAAARLRTMSVDQLAHRLDDRFRLLTSGSRTALPRHRTLRAVVDWSWELLTDAERAVLRRLSVFSGGASLEGAERVCAGYADDVAPGGDGGHANAADAVLAPEHVLELLTALTEKSLLRAEGGTAPRYRMLGTIKEYAGQRLAEAGEADLARREHLAYVSGLAETAEPHLRRAEQLEWLAVLDAEHDNIGAAMRGALAAGEAQAAMRLAAGAGWYWWLSGHRTEGFELITAATRTPGAVTDDVRATVYGLVVLFVTSGPGDEHQAAEWIHKAYEFGRRGRGGRRNHPLIGLVAPLERMLREPGAGVSAFEELLDHEDPWARALARLLMGKMRIMLGPDGQGGGPDGQDGQDVDAHLAQAIAEFQSLGERFGISFAQTEFAARIAVRGEFAAACEHYEQAIAAIAEVGATEDVIPIRSAQAQSYRLLGDKAASAAALADAERCAERVTWPGSLAVLAFAKAELARWDGDVAQARAQLDVARDLLGEEAERANIRSMTYDLLGYLTDDLDEARAHRAAACAAAAEAGHAPVIARALVGVADLAQRRGDHEQAVRLLAAGEAVLGLTDRSHPDAARIERTARSRLGDTRFAEAALEGRRTGWSELAGVTLAS
ncbi:BTAD domain-containing putative transcriptional regulator [Streptomyces alboflavus]|uniref:BTAD domain-containing putative transcriptional regulator n=1 Tax=Streptomyces alboflavus TaxID=67267 RepID=UPI0004C2827B|nr:BTAD domain-containing putative transcriptional regulator [Streptomyces alboflavus]